MFMSHQLFHRWEINSSHHETTRKSVPQVMEREIWDFRFLDGSLE